MTAPAFATWAPVAPMGWNSWDCFGASVTEAEVLANARYMAAHLKAAGYAYVVVDIQWSEPTADSTQYHPFAALTMDDYGRLQPAVNRFPSAANGAGFGPLARELHALGLRFGLHIMRGIPRQAVAANVPILGTKLHARDVAVNNICPWNADMYGVADTPGGQAYYDSLVRQYAEWGVDFLKVDDICHSTLYGIHAAEIAALRRAIDDCGRPIVLSLSPGPASLEHGAFLQAHANMWRLTDDFWDTWPQLVGMFPVAAKWAPLVQPGTWPDLDMLPLGAIRQRAVDAATAQPYSRFTVAEQQTMLTLWGLMRAPLMLGGHLPASSEVVPLVTNRDWLAMRRTITWARQTQATPTSITWRATSANRCYVARFNLTDAAVALTGADIGVSSGWSIWGQAPVASQLMVPAHGVALIRCNSDEGGED